jgi:hypothetical protein
LRFSEFLQSGKLEILQNVKFPFHFVNPMFRKTLYLSGVIFGMVLASENYTLGASMKTQKIASLQAVELFQIFEEILGRFAALECSFIGHPVEGPAQSLTLECILSLRGPATGKLVLRTVPEVGEMLAKACRYEGAPEEGEGRDAFFELSNLFVGHLLTRVWGSQGEPFRTFVPRNSNPGLWPGAPVTIGCALLLEDRPVEIRLWLEGEG